MANETSTTISAADFLRSAPPAWPGKGRGLLRRLPAVCPRHADRLWRRPGRCPRDHGWRAAGDQEDVQGKPFVGPAGKLLDRAMVDAGLDRGTVYVTNAVKHFKWTPAGQRRLHSKPTSRGQRLPTVAGSRVRRDRTGVSGLSWCNRRTVDVRTDVSDDARSSPGSSRATGRLGPWRRFTRRRYSRSGRGIARADVRRLVHDLRLVAEKL